MSPIIYQFYSKYSFSHEKHFFLATCHSLLNMVVYKHTNIVALKFELSPPPPWHFYKYCIIALLHHYFGIASVLHLCSDEKTDGSAQFWT